MPLEHFCASIPTVHVDTVLADADEILVGLYDSFTIFNPATSSVTSLTVYAAPESGGTFLPLYSSAKVAVTIVTMVTGAAYQLSFAGYALKVIKFVSNADGDLPITMKS